MRTTLREFFDRAHAACERVGLGLIAEVGEEIICWTIRLFTGGALAWIVSVVTEMAGVPTLVRLAIGTAAFAVGAILLAPFALPHEVQPSIANAFAFGSAQFCGTEPDLGEGFLLLGRDSQGNLVKTSQHVLTCASTGGGKGVGCVIPNLLLYPGSAFVLDVKGENYAVTAEARRRLGQKVVVIDPFGVSGEQSDAYNWFHSVRTRTDDFLGDASLLADAVVPSAAGDEHWEESARDIVRALICYFADCAMVDGQIQDVRRALTASPAEQKKLLSAMSKVTVANEAVSRAAISFLAKSEKERAAVLSTAQRHTAFLDDPRIIDVTGRSSFDLFSIKNQPTTVYLIIPPDRIASYGRFVRGFLSLAIASITRIASQTRFPFTFFLDEFAQFGHLRIFEIAISLMRGYGARFWIFVQDLAQLKAQYPGWQSFLANSCTQAFATADYDTAHYLSLTIGMTTTYAFSASFNPDDVFDAGRGSTRQHGRPLLTPDEILCLPDSMVIALQRGRRPCIAARLNYLVDAEFAGLYKPNPMHRGIGAGDGNRTHVISLGS